MIRPVPMVHPCSAPQCSTLTMGAFCVEHEAAAVEPQPARSRTVAFAALVGASAGILAAFLARARLPLS
jgi:hypothetical protein